MSLLAFGLAACSGPPAGPPPQSTPVAAIGAGAAVYGPATPVAPPASEAPTIAMPSAATSDDPLHQLGKALEELVPAAEAPAVKAAAPEEADEVRQEMAELRDQVNQLRANVDSVMGAYVAELKAENERLRREVQRLSAAGGAAAYSSDAAELPVGGAFVPGVSTPGPAAPQTVPDQNPPPASSDDRMALAVHDGLNYAVISEWGRSPEDTAKLGSNMSSLKGMICVVPGGSSDESLLSFGRWLRTEYTHYDNINIEVFDQREAAQAYADNNTPSPEHRVLSISKHRLSGRDALLVLHNGALTEVGPGEAVSPVGATAPEEKTPDSPEKTPEQKP